MSYRSRQLVRACLESLRAHPPAFPISVHVVDNASNDGTVEMIQREFPDVRVTALHVNVGFGAANNLAIRGGEGTYFLALNPDTRVTSGSLDGLMQVMDERSDVGICGCRLVRDDGSPDEAARRSFPTITGALGYFLGVARHSRAPTWLAQYHPADDRAGPIDAVNGAFMLIRRSALDEVGGFDEGYWMYMEDLDLCYRFREAGWLTWYEPSISVWHVKHGTSGPVRSLRLNYAFHYGMFRFYRKHYAQRHRAGTNAVVYAGIAAKLAVSTVRTAVGRFIRRVRAGRTGASTCAP